MFYFFYIFYFLLNVTVSPVERRKRLDMLGQSIFRRQVVFSNRKVELQLGNLPGGMYLLQIAGNDGKMSNYKFIVQ